MKMGKLATVLLIVVTVVPLFWAPAAAQRGPGPGEPELRREMRRYLHGRLQAELSLSDEQADAMLPVVDALEAERREFHRDRMDVMRRLHDGIRSGASDEELQALLDQWREGRIRHEKNVLEMEKRIDDHLNVRQRVQFRFFTQRFRREMEERVRRLRGRRRGSRSSPPRGPGDPRGPRRP